MATYKVLSLEIKSTVWQVRASSPAAPLSSLIPLFLISSGRRWHSSHRLLYTAPNISVIISEMGGTLITSRECYMHPSEVTKKKSGGLDTRGNIKLKWI